MTEDVRYKQPIRPSHINRITPDDGEIIVGGPDGPERRPLSEVLPTPDDMAMLDSAAVRLSSLEADRVPPAEWTATKAAVDRVGRREFIADLSTVATDNITRINATIAEAAAAGGGRVGIPTGRTFPIRPSKASGAWIKLAPNVTLDLGDATLRVANDADPYLALITGTTPETMLTNVRVVGGMIDQNPAGHETAAISTGGTHPTAAIVSYNYDGFVVDGVTFITGGINTVSLNSPTGRHGAVNDSTFTFIRGASAIPDYDNSAVYLEGVGVQAHGNRFFSEITHRARGCVELHGAQGAMSGNAANGYQTMVNIVPLYVPRSGTPSGSITVSGNTAINAQKGIQVWPTNTDTLYDVVIASNTISLDGPTWNSVNVGGVAVNRTVGVNGTVDGLTVQGNIIRFMPDTRTTAEGGAAIDYAGTFGINTVEAGTTRHARILDNTVINSPAYGIKIGTTDLGGVLHASDVRGNLIVDAGYNPNVPSGARASIGVMGTVHDVMVTDNPLRDTGTPGNRAAYGVNSSPSTTSTNIVVMRNHQRTASGTALPALLNATTESNYLSTSLDFGSIAANGISGLPVTVKGARSGNIVQVSALFSTPAGLVFSGYVSADDTVMVTAYNMTEAAIDPASLTVRVRVLKPGIDY